MKKLIRLLTYRYYKIMKLSMSDIFYIGLYSKLDEQGFHYGIYDRAIQLGRRTLSPYHQTWTVELMYS